MKKIWIYALACAMVAGLAACGEKPTVSPEDETPPHITPPEKPVEVKPTYPKDDGVLRLVSYNVGAFSKYTNSIEMIAKMMKELDADIVGMNETDSCTTRSGRVYQAKVLAEKIGGWHYYFSRSIVYQNGGYGNSIVASDDFKMLGTQKITIPAPIVGGKPKGEVRSCAIMKTDKFVFMSTHLDHTGGAGSEGEAARLEGVRLITEWAKKNYGNSDMPVFVCGDMNCEPNDAPIKKFQDDWTLLSVTDNTYPSNPAKKCIDFIFVYNNNAKYEFLKSEVPLKFANGDVTQASDHLPIYVDVKLK